MFLRGVHFNQSYPRIKLLTTRFDLSNRGDRFQRLRAYGFPCVPCSLRAVDVWVQHSASERRRLIASGTAAGRRERGKRGNKEETTRRMSIHPRQSGLSADNFQTKSALPRRRWKGARGERLIYYKPGSHSGTVVRCVGAHITVNAFSPCPRRKTSRVPRLRASPQDVSA